MLTTRAVAQLELQPPRGTRDFYPPQLRQRDWLFAQFRNSARQFGFQEVDAPVVETRELYERKAGEEITAQLYHFNLHGRNLALRPEFTPSLARMVLARRGALKFPLRWFSVPQCWRYERLQKGRRREHYQWNMDVWGEASVAAEAELCAAMFHCLDAVQLPAASVQLRVNHRALFEEALRARFLAKRPEAFAPLCIIVDKLEKIGADAVQQLLADPKGPVQLSAAAAREITALLQTQSLEEAARWVPANSPALAELRRFFALLEGYGLAQRARYSASIVRGLAYYTGIVFEAVDAKGELRTLCGGGRYDRLAQSLGGKALPAAGFGFGDAVITELLAREGRLPQPARAPFVIVYPMLEAARPAAQRLASALRAEGGGVELVLAACAKAKRVFADADKSGAQAVYVIGEQELADGAATRRELASGAEQKVQLP